MKPQPQPPPPFSLSLKNTHAHTHTTVGQACDAHHITTPHPEGAGLAKAIELALADAGLAKEDLTYINAHGTSTAYNDKVRGVCVSECVCGCVGVWVCVGVYV